MHTVFVYGSLMQGYGNHGLLTEETTTFVGRATIEEFALHSLGSFPAIVPDVGNGSVVYGEVYAVSDSTLARLDRLEGHPTFYKREPVKLQGLDATPFVYVYQGEVHRPCPSGDWRDYHAARRT